MNYLLRSLPVVAFSVIVLLQSGISFEPTLSRAIQQSNDQQRPLMLLFVSKNCTDCLPVQEYLEGDAVKEAVARQYVAARVDIDDFDGRACSEIYGIGEVPALVIVDSKGTIMYKVQGEISLEELAGMIEETAETIEEAQMAEELVAANDTKQPLELNPDEMADELPHITAGIVQTDDSEEKQASRERVIRERQEEPVTEIVEEPAPAPVPAKPQARPVTQQMTVSGKSYSLQLGFFSNRDYAIRLQEKAQQNGLQGVEIRPVRRDGKDFFRVLFGRYPTAQAADLSSTPLKQSGFDVKVHRN